MQDVIAEIEAEIRDIRTGHRTSLSALAQLAMAQGQETQAAGFGALSAALAKAVQDAQKTPMICCGYGGSFVGRYRNVERMPQSDCEDLLGTVLADSACNDAPGGDPDGRRRGSSWFDICNIVPCIIKSTGGEQIGTLCEKDWIIDEAEIEEISIVVKSQPKTASSTR